MFSRIVKRISAVYCCVWCVLVIAIPMQLNAQENSIPVSITIADKSDPQLPPLVYVDGALAGAIGGTVQIPAAAESTLEIGLPQSRRPLYSFSMGPKQLSGGTTDVVMTSYSYTDGNAESVWDNVNLDPNKVASIRLKTTGTGGYEIKLPASAYDSYEEIIRKFSVSQATKNWMEAIPETNDKSVGAGINHLTAASNMSGSWSGAYAVAVRNSWPSPGYSEREWRITSEPPGAKIMTQVGNKGFTNRTVQLPNLSETFVVLQLAGYVDCPHSDELCTLTDTGKIVDLRCTLKRR